MSEPKRLNQLPSTASPSGTWVVLTNANGEAIKVKPNILSQEINISAGDIANLDELIIPGIYGTGSTTDISALPEPTQEWRVALVEVYQRGTLIFHRITSQNGRMAVRVKAPGGGAWGSWRILQST